MIFFLSILKLNKSNHLTENNVNCLNMNNKNLKSKFKL